MCKKHLICISSYTNLREQTNYRAMRRLLSEKTISTYCRYWHLHTRSLQNGFTHIILTQSIKILTFITGLLFAEGLHLIEVLLDDVSVPKSPFRVSVSEGCDPSRVRAYGPGLEEGLVNKPNRFTVETRYCHSVFKSRIDFVASIDLCLNILNFLFVLCVPQRCWHWGTWPGHWGSIRGKNVM